MAARKPIGSALPSVPVVGPFMGVTLGGASFTSPPKSFDDCLNVRLRFGEVTNDAMGWAKFTSQQLNGPVTFVGQFEHADETTTVVAGTLTDLYQWDDSNLVFNYLTPRYETGTVTTTSPSTTVTGVGTAWSTNVKIGDYIAFTAAGETSASATWIKITNVTDNTHLTVASQPPVVAGHAYTIRKTFTASSIQNYWTTAFFPRADVNGDGTLYEDTMFFTNGLDYVVTWNGTADQVTIRSSLAFKCYRLVKYKNMMIYYNFTDDSGPTVKHGAFKNSDVGRPFVMSGAGTLAGEFQVSPKQSPLKAAVPLGDDLIFYTHQEVITCSFVGGTDVFAFRTAIPTRGVFGPRLVAQYSDFHQFLGNDGVYWFNGAQATLVDTQVWKYITRIADANRHENSWVHLDQEYGETLWTVGLAGETTDEPQYSFVGHYLEAPGLTTQNYVTEVHSFPYTIRNMPFVCAGVASRNQSLRWIDITTPWSQQDFTWTQRLVDAAFPFTLVGSFDGYVYILNSSNTQNTVAFNSFVRFPRRFVTDVRHRSLLRRVYVFTGKQDGTYPLLVDVNMYDHPEGDATYSEQFNFGLDLTGNHFVAPYRRGRLFDVKFSTPGATPDGQTWTLSGYDVDCVLGGER